MGFTVSAPTVSDLFACAGEALYSAMCDRRTVRRLEERVITLEADDPESLLVAWLDELIYLFETEAFLARNCRVEVEGGLTLRAKLIGEGYDPSRHRLVTVFKGATWHHLRVVREGDGWRATVIMDV